jgi:hypothetical protein
MIRAKWLLEVFIMNRKPSLVATAVLAILCLSGSPAAQDRPDGPPVIEVSESATAQLKELLEKQKIDAMLVDGTYVKGKVVEVSEGEVVVDVKESSGTTRIGRGEQRIPLRNLGTLYVTARKGNKRYVLIPLMAAGLAGLGLLLSSGDSPEEDDPASDAILPATFAVGGGVMGYVLGRQLDRHEFTLVIKH